MCQLFWPLAFTLDNSFILRTLAILTPSLNCSSFPFPLPFRFHSFAPTSSGTESLFVYLKLCAHPISTCAIHTISSHRIFPVSCCRFSHCHHYCHIQPIPIRYPVSPPIFRFLFSWLHQSRLLHTAAYHSSFVDVLHHPPYVPTPIPVVRPHQSHRQLPNTIFIRFLFL